MGFLVLILLCVIGGKVIRCVLSDREADEVRLVVHSHAAVTELATSGERVVDLVHMPAPVVNLFHVSGALTDAGDPQGFIDEDSFSDDDFAHTKHEAVFAKSVKTLTSGTGDDV